MYGIFTYIWVIFKANVGKYSIHGAYGNGSCQWHSGSDPAICLLSVGAGQWLMAQDRRYRLITSCCSYNNIRPWMNINWLVVEPPTPLKNDGVKVSWDDYSIPNMMGKS